ncbi:YfcC family protein [Peijinzhouia sedimentorum]
MKFPSAITILLVIAGLVAISTWLIPAGSFDSISYNADEQSFIRKGIHSTTTLPATQATLDELNVKIPVEKFTSGAIYRPVSIPGTYQNVTAKPQGFAAFVLSPMKGIIQAADIIFLVLIMGGLIGVMNASGSFTAGIAWLTHLLKNKEFLLIILTTFLVALGGTTFSFGEEAIALYLIIVPVFMAAGYDALVGFACVFLGSCVGIMCSTISPFMTIIASDAAGIVWTTGLYGRLAMFIICVSITIIYILRYASKVKKKPSSSIVFSEKEILEEYMGINAEKEIAPLNTQRILILLIFMSSFVLMIFGVSILDWWFVEITTLFLCTTIIVGIIARMKETEFLETFMKGAGELLSVAFIIGIARGVSILMQDGMINDTILYYSASLTDGLDKGVFVNVMFIIYNGLSFLIPSSTGMAVLTIPVFAPLADTAGFGREVIVNTFQFGNGLFNIINPTSLVLPGLAVVKIGYNRFLRFVWPLMLILFIVTVIFLTIQVYS